jgi:hypothetical protein
MRIPWKLRPAGLILALLIAICAAGIVSWAWADTPIVIADGSLTLNSAVPWNQYTGTGDIKSHPHTGKTVASVVVTVAGTDQPLVTFKKQACTVDITYAGEHITFSTGTNGKGLIMRPFSHFLSGSQPTDIVHVNPNDHISHVKVIKGTAIAFESDVTGNTKITIHYQ